MSIDVHLTGTLQFAPKIDSNTPQIGPFPLNLTLSEQKEPFVTTVEIKPTDTLGTKILDLPAFLLDNQNLVVIVTDMPVVVQYRDTAPTPVTVRKTLRHGGFLIFGGGDYAIDQIDFEGIASSAPQARVTVFVVGG